MLLPTMSRKLQKFDWYILWKFSGGEESQSKWALWQEDSGTSSGTSCSWTESFFITKEMLINGSLYKEACLDGLGYTQFISWAVLQQRYAALVNGTKEEEQKFVDHCQLIYDCANVYDSWDVIVKNLTNNSITFSNAKHSALTNSWELSHGHGVLRKMSVLGFAVEKVKDLPLLRSCGQIWMWIRLPVICYASTDWVRLMFFRQHSFANKCKGGVWQ